MIFLGCLIFIGIYLVVEHIRLKNSRIKIPLRIHVYGTRGKTTATHAIYETLRQAGFKVFGKTTGDQPKILLPNGDTKPLHRRGPARIQEYVNCLHQAEQLQCDAVVFECMAITPETICVAKDILDPTHVVLTNTRPDHQETMGKTPLMIAQTLALSVHYGSHVFYTQDKYGWCIEEQAQAKDCTIHPIEEQKVAPALQTHHLIQCLAKNLNITALPAPEASWPTFECCHVEGIGHFKFLDLFSANDIESSAQLLEQALIAEQIKNLPLVALLATRPDRPLRTVAFIEWFTKAPPFSLYVTQGWHCFYAQIAMKQRQLAPRLLTLNPTLPPETLLLKIKKQMQGQEFGVVGLGNFHHYGEQFRAFISEKRKVCF